VTVFVSADRLCRAASFARRRRLGVAARSIIGEISWPDVQVLWNSDEAGPPASSGSNPTLSSTGRQHE
jgi:hypothetical protein